MAVGVTDTKSKSSNVTVIFKVINQATAELRKISSEFTKIDNQAKEVAKVGGMDAGFAKAGAAVLKFGAVVAGAVAGFMVAKVALTELLNVGEEGAAFLQTTESFENMTSAMGVSTDLLRRLREATQGTIGDMQLMSYATTAMAGASEEFGRQIGENLPKLAEIAKAANKANPALGSVDYQFQSLIIGLKRLSPRLIDNTGLQLKLGEAYRTFAEKAGKATDELTSEEQQLALLNATMEAGDRLINQIGGTAASMTDPFGRFEAAVDNTTNAIKGRMFPVLADLAEWLARAVTDWGAKEIQNLQATEEQVYSGAAGWQQYNTVVNQLASDYGYLIDESGNLIKRQYDMTGAIDTVIVSGFALTETQYDLAKAVEYDAQKIEHLNKILGQNVKAGDLANASAEQLKKAMSDLQYVISAPVSKAYNKHIETMDDLKATQADLITQITELGGANWLDPMQADKIAAIRGELGGTWSKMKELETAIEDGLGPKKKYAAEQNLKTLGKEAASLKKELEGMGVKNFNVTPQGIEKLGELKTKLEEVQAALDEETAAWKENQKQIMLDMVQRQLFAVLPEGAAISAYGEVAEKMGLIDSETADAYGMVGELSSLFATDKIDVQEYAGAVGLLAKYLGELPDKVTVDLLLKYTTIGSLPGVIGGTTAGTVIGKTGTVQHPVGGYTAANTPAVFHRREVYMPGRSGYTLAANDLKQIMTEMGFGGGGGGGGVYVDFRGSSIGSREDIEILAYKVAEQISRRRR